MRIYYYVCLGNLQDKTVEATSDAKDKTQKKKLSVSNILWILSAAVFFYSSDIITVSLFDDRVKRLDFTVLKVK